MNKWSLELFDKDGEAKPVEKDGDDEVFTKFFYDEDEAMAAYMRERIKCEWLPVLWKAKSSGHFIMGREVPQWEVVHSCSKNHPEGMTN